MFTDLGNDASVKRMLFFSAAGFRFINRGWYQREARLSGSLILWIGPEGSLVDRSLTAYLDSLYQSGREHDAPLGDRLLRLRNMTPAAAGLVAQLIRVQGSRHVLEIGTSNGYSAIWFADAVRDTKGVLTTVEIDADRVAEARRNLESAGVADVVTVVHGDGADVLGAVPDGAIDLLVLDAERPAYTGYWPHISRALAEHGVIAVDNAVSHGEQLLEFRKLLTDDGDFSVCLHEVGDGVLTAVRVE